MTQDKEKTVMIIRKWADGEYIAIMPYELGTYSPYTCMSYMHIGQHGSCDPMIVMNTKHTNNDDSQAYRDFIAELESIGYNLDIRKHIPSDSLENRRKQLKSI